MNSRGAKDYLCALLESHGLAFTTHEDWVVPYDKLPAIRALWHPGEPTGRLDVQVINEDQSIIEECFAGFDTGNGALHDAFENFTRNSFHVLLAAVWDVNDPDQVTVEHWEIGGKPFTAYIGNYGTRSADGITPRIPDTLFADIERAIRDETLAGDLHWFRLFFANFSGSPTFEALMDNEVWAAGRRCLEAAPWVKSDGYYSVRLFLMLRAQSHPADVVPT